MHQNSMLPNVQRRRNRRLNALPSICRICRTYGAQESFEHQILQIFRSDGAMVWRRGRKGFGRLIYGVQSLFRVYAKGTELPAQRGNFLRAVSRLALQLGAQSST